tara:strand:+ start:248 stop:514 length:267 start_codon:yes stop_codon:yes gene_type:complete
MLMSITVSNVMWEGAATTDELSKDELRLLMELTVATWDPKKLLLKAYLLGCHNPYMRVWADAEEDPDNTLPPIPASWSHEARRMFVQG